MKRRLMLVSCLAFCGVASGGVTMKIADKVQPVSHAFPPGDVVILPGAFKDAEQADLKYLLSLEPDRLLSGFRTEAGLKPKGEKYGGWESRGVAGQSFGHWLTACALMHKATGDTTLVERVNYAVGELAEVQQASGDGALIAYPDGKKIFREIAAGDVRSQGFDLNGGWVPWYTNHKVLAGLIDVHRYTGNAKALDVARRFADWSIEVTKTLTPEQWQTMLACEHGGMNESLAELYAITGEKKYEDLARKFHHDKVLSPLADGRDILPGLHANTQIPKVIGLARLYELDGNEADRKAASFFWNTVVDTQTFANGGNSRGEHFGKPHTLGARLSGDTAETCNTYNMLKLARHLYTWEQDPQQRMKLADYIERATFNHILASQDPATGMVIYFSRMGQGVKKEFSTPFDSFWCCVGTGMENHAKYGDSIYFKTADSLTMDQFIASEVKWAEKGVMIQQETRFPNEAQTTVTVKANGPSQFTLCLRVPRWVTQSPTITINGDAISSTAAAGTYAEISREWKDGDRIEMSLPMGMRSESLADAPSKQAFFYGPILLAGNVPEEKSAHPVIVDDNKPIEQWLKPENVQELLFEMSPDVSRPAAIELKPFYRLNSGAYTVYFDRFDNAQWQAKQAELRAEQQRLADLQARTVDQMDIAEMQPERDHELTSEKSTIGEHAGRKWRHAESGGFFEFNMKVDPAAKNALLITFFGGDAGREFSLLVDGKPLAEVKLKGEQPDQFFDATYPLHPSLTNGKTSVRVRVQANDKGIAGGVYGTRMVRRD